MAVTCRATEIPGRIVGHAGAALDLDLEGVAADGIARPVTDETARNGARQVAIGLQKLVAENHARLLPLAPTNNKGQGFLALVGLACALPVRSGSAK